MLFSLYFKYIALGIEIDQVVYFLLCSLGSYLDCIIYVIFLINLSFISTQLHEDKIEWYYKDLYFKKYEIQSPSLFRTRALYKLHCSTELLTTASLIHSNYGMFKLETKLLGI